MVSADQSEIAGRMRPSVFELDPLTITGRFDNLKGISSTASEGRVGAADLRLRPITREGELLETVPGVIVTQHSGDGKANQYFVRGFNLDHGTDFETRIEGMPVNMPSHAHGQGYTDLNFLIPELVDYIDYRLGVYHADLGDFGSAGGAEFHLKRRLDSPFAVAGAGENGLARFSAGASKRVGSGDLLLAGEAKGYNGPWRSPRKSASSAVWPVTPGTADHRNSRFWEWPITTTGIRATRSRCVRSRRLVNRFGEVDASDGGNTERYSLSGSWRRSGGNSAQEVQIFGIYSDLSLFSNFGYFLNDPVRGDQFNQREHRVVLGANAKHSQELEAFGVAHILRVGVQTRADIINGLGLYHTEARSRLGTVRQDDVREWGSGLFVETASRWRPWFRTVFGARGDVYTFNVAGDRSVNSGYRSAAIFSPKASLVFVPTGETELYLSGGLGFHSNDARGTTITIDPTSGAPAERVNPLVRSRGAEVGARVTPLHGWRSTIAVWMLNLNSELLFTGDGGATEPSAASRRRGITWANFYRPIPQLSLDADVSLSRARFTGVAAGQNHIPGALENVVAAGATWSSLDRGPFGSIRLRHFGSYSLIEDNSVRAKPTTLVNAELGYLFSGIRLQASVLNLFNTVADDIQYYYTSRLEGEPAQGVDDIHFHPVEPRQIRVSLGWGI